MPVDGDTKHRVEQLRLLAKIRIRHCCAVDELEQLVAFRSCFGMHREKYAACFADRNISDRQPVRQHLLQFVLMQDRRGRQIRIRISTTVTNPRGDGGSDEYCQKEEQYVFH